MMSLSYDLKPHPSPSQITEGKLIAARQNTIASVSDGLPFRTQMNGQILGSPSGAAIESKSISVGYEVPMTNFKMTGD